MAGGLRGRGISPPFLLRLMCTTSEMKARFERVRDTFPAIVMNIAQDTHEELEDKNRKQMYAGKRPDGTEIGPEYTPLTKFLKQRKGQPHDRVTLEDEGDYYKAITLRINTQTFSMEDSDYKTPALEAKYGVTLGLSTTSIDEYRAETLKPRVKDRVREITGTG